MRCKRLFGLLPVIGLVVLVSCGDDDKPTNSAPTMPEISPADFTIMPGDSVLLTGQATDPDGDPVTYIWTMDGGTPLTATGTSVVWRAPQGQNVTTEIRLTASDDRGNSTTATMAALAHSDAAFDYTTPFATPLEPDLTHLESKSAKLPDTQCHSLASFVVTWTTASVVVFTGLPTLAFEGALLRTPVWYFPDTWVWAYTVPWLGSLATVEVSATLTQPTLIDWTMSVSGTLMQYDRFVWVTGQSNTAGTQGHWVLNDHRVTETQTPALRLDWSRTSQTDVDLDYENILATSDGLGDTLSYSLHGSDAEVVLFDLSEPRTLNVRWDTLTGAGSFGVVGGSACCWGEAPDYLDIDCP